MKVWQFSPSFILSHLNFRSKQPVALGIGVISYGKINTCFSVDAFQTNLHALKQRETKHVLLQHPYVCQEKTLQEQEVNKAHFLPQGRRQHCWELMHCKQVYRAQVCVRTLCVLCVFVYVCLCGYVHCVCVCLRVCVYLCVHV